MQFCRLFGYSLDDGRSISRNEASLNTIVHDMINLLWYDYSMNTEQTNENIFTYLKMYYGEVSFLLSSLK